MWVIKDMISIYIVLVMLGIGLFMVFMQSRDLTHVARLEREGAFAKAVGWIYIVLSILGFVIISL